MEGWENKEEGRGEREGEATKVRHGGAESGHKAMIKLRKLKGEGRRCRNRQCFPDSVHDG